MNKHKLWTLTAGSGLAVMGLLLVLLLLGRSTAGATAGGDAAIPEMRSPGGSFTVSGTVTCQATGPLSGVEVFAWSRDKGTGFVGDVTDSSGAYRVTLEDGTYDLIFNPRCGSGCASKAHKGVSGLPDLILNVVLSPGYTISGTVFATNGVTPVEGVSIYAFHHDTADGFGLPLTKADGRYCIGLITGTYDLGFTPPPCRGLGPKTEVIAVTQDMTHNVVLSPGFTVAGCVTDGSGNPVPGVQIYAYDPAIRGFGFAPSGESGCYTGTLPLGTFDIQFIPPAGRGLGPLTVVNVVSETASCPNTSLPITLPTGFTISGRVTCLGQPVKNVFVYANPARGGAPGDDLVGWGLYTVDDGSYGLPVVPGIYDIKFVPPTATGFDMLVTTGLDVVTDTVLSVDLCIRKSVDELLAVQGERRTYQIVLSPTQDFAAAHLTDTLPSAVTWAGNLSATSGSAIYDDGIVTWNGSLTTGVPLTISYGVTMTHALCRGAAAYTDIYTDVVNDAVLDDGQGNVFYSNPAVFAIAHPFGTGRDRTFDMAFGDADNDGDLDLAMGGHTPNQACWNNGDGTFKCEDAFRGDLTFDVDWGKINKDDFLDLVVARAQGRGNLTCTQVITTTPLVTTTHTFTCTAFSICPVGQVCRTALGDVDGDGDLDIALAVWQLQNLIYFNDGNGAFPITATTCTDAGWTRDLGFGDMDNDGDLDLVVVGDSPDYVCINNGTGIFTETRWITWRIDSTRSMDLGDVDGDGDLDVVAGEASDRQSEVYLNDGQGNFPSNQVIRFGPQSDVTLGVSLGDVDSDGDLDIAVGNKNYQHKVIYFNDPVTAADSITFTRRLVLGADPVRTNSVALGDVDGDGDLDLAVGNDREQNIVYINTLVSVRDVAIVKSGDPPMLKAGDRLTYTLTYSNDELGIATGILITDAVPSTLTDVSYTYAGAILTPTDSIRYAWEVEDLAPGEGGAITVTGTVSPSVSGVFSLTNRATIATDCPDDNLDNNASVVHTPVDAEPPEIVATAPASGAMDVYPTAPVVITFSEPIEASTFAYTITPNPGGWSGTWSAGGAAVALAHHSFAYSTTYAVTVTAADDLVGNPLSGAPYAWRFATAPYRVYLPLVMRNYP